MIKFIILAVALLQQLLLQADCLFISESCEVESQYGTCLPLSKCHSIANEIKRAGNPMPKYMRMKLQKLSCGFEFTEPLICCIPSSFDDTTHDFETHHQGNERPQHKPNDVVFPGTEQDDNGNKESSTKRTVEDRSGPRDVAGHPNIDLLPPECGIIDSNRIWGGNRTSLYEMPFMVLLSYDSDRGLKLSCSGTIINKWYILTAAHCVTNLSKLRLRLNGVIIGEYDVRHDPDCETSDGIVQCAPNVMNHTIDTVIPHPGYTPPSLVDDIALLRLSEPADLSLDSVKPICLPVTRNRQTEPLAGLNGVVAGWGITEDGLQSPVLLSVNLPIVSPKDCEAAYNGAIHISVTQICAGGVKNKDSCGGDSGGPLMYPGKFGSLGVRYIQRGIVSFGSKRCGISGYPGVYTNVAYYMDWILDNIHD